MTPLYRTGTGARLPRFRSLLLVLLTASTAFANAIAAVGGLQVKTTKSGISVSLAYRGEQASPITPAELRYRGKPPLPFHSTFVIVPPNAGVAFDYLSDPLTYEPLLDDSKLLTDPELPLVETAGIIPASPVEVSKPVVMRGVRMVKVTLYPSQYDPDHKRLIHNSNLTASLRFTNDPPVNPARYPSRVQRGSEFARVLEQLAVNSADWLRDNADDGSTGSNYLVVVNENCLPYVGRFIEWRRKSGVPVEILSIPNNIAQSDTAEIKRRIQARYNAALDAGQEPFDQLLLIGDRSGYREGPQAGWVLAAPYGETIWPAESGGAGHADFKYACLSGDDDWPDVGFARWCAGSPDILNLFVGRTLGYEATPYTDDLRWFTKGAVYSQHWGNLPDAGAWHITLPSNLRWAEQLMKARQFTDLRLQEDYNYDQYGGDAGLFERNLIDEKVNLLLGRVETLYWAEREPLNDNNVFPIRFSISGHGEFGTFMLLRTGSGDHLKGPVFATCGWGGPTTTASNAVWDETVRGFLNLGLSMGWSRTLAITSSERFFPQDFWFAAQPVNGSMKVDYDYYGDPGLKPWIGVPKIVNVECPASVDPFANYFSFTIRSAANGAALPGVKATLYAPGNIPRFDDARYATYEGMQSWTTRSDDNGEVHFSLGTGERLVEGTPLYLTVSDDGIKPFFATMAIERQASSVVLTSYALSETNGNGDGRVNPGEAFSLLLTAANTGQDLVNDVRAEVSSLSTNVEVTNGANVIFGNIASGNRADGQSQTTLRISSICPDGSLHLPQKPVLQVTFTSGNLTWKSSVSIDCYSPEIRLIVVPDGNNVAQDGQARLLDIYVINKGRIVSTPFGVKLNALGEGLTVVHDSVTFPSLNPNERQYCNGAPLSVVADRNAIPGSICPMQLGFAMNSGFRNKDSFNLSIGSPGENNPQAPDKYGYIAYDDGDQNWRNHPHYNWIEINPNDQQAAFDGTEVPFIRRSGFEVGEALVVPLNFTTSLYGQTFDSVTIGTNGYILPGNQVRVINPQNWPLDQGIGCGLGTIAPFWDWLKFANYSRVYTYYDPDGGMFIVEWYRMRLRSNDQSDLTFQAILYDRARWARESGDPDILFQYASIENLPQNETNDVDNPYASVGISSPDGTTGVSYAYGPDYPASSKPLEDRMALLFTTSYRSHNGMVYGQVRSVESGDPLPGVKVRTHYALSTTTDQNGRYQINGVVEDYRLVLTAGGNGYADSSQGVHLAVGDSAQIDFVLRRGAGVEPSQQNAPMEFGLSSAFPNPFNSSTQISFELPLTGKVRLAVYDLSGREIAKLVDGELAVGRHRVTWRAEGVPSGVYVVRLLAHEKAATTKVVLLR